ncbi:phosphotransferase family protein [uncultured Modestobacter sp.]|uniref:phosphotransferase family protein n=1 Tax=uncultured Modestobacter sp. TaxID=380048 RepID=UPI00261786C4|nr:phosphotransferase family protein [uncultured Modestobacter sp.]
MPESPHRDLAATSAALGPLLAAQLGVDDVEVSALVLPKAGYSNETIMFTAAWQGPDGHRVQDLVLRIEPTGHQLFVQPDALAQAAVMRGLAGHPGVPVPRIWLTSADRSLFGAPFYVMERRPGRVPADVPSYHRAGWFVDLPPEERARAHDAGLAALAALHRVDPAHGLGFLVAGSDTVSPGTALDRHLAQLVRWNEWCGSSRRFGPDVLDAAMEHLLGNRPDDPAAGVVWGDARVGNMIFADDLSVSAMLDWEAATVGPPGIDLGWWLMFEDYLCEAQGLQRLPGVPDRAATIARYQELGGAEIAHVDWYELLACVVMALIGSRLADLLVSSGQAPEEVARKYPERSVRMAARLLAGPGR